MRSLRRFSRPSTAPSSRIAFFGVAASAAFALPLVASAAVPTGWAVASSIDGGTTSIGSSIATTDTIAVVGAPFAPSTASGAPVGAAFVYANDGGVWSSQKIIAPSPIDGGNFGTSVAASGNLVAVGAAGTPPAAYVFADNAGTYESTLTIADPKTDKNGSFGGSVAVFAGQGTNYVAVAAPPGSANPDGLVFVSRQIAGGAWSTPPVSISDTSADAFGIAIAFAGNGDLLVGDPGTGAGQVLVYAPEADGGWSSAGTLPFALDGGTVQQFGNGIATWNDLVVVTAPETSDGANTYNGAAFVFASNDAGVWTQEAVLTGAKAESFGGFIPAVGNGTIAVGSAVNTVSSGAGQVDVWAASGGTWVPVPSTSLVGDSYYGQAVGSVGGFLFIGDTSALGAAAISDVTSRLLIERPLEADGGAVLDATAGANDASSADEDGATPALDGALPAFDGATTTPTGDAASTSDDGGAIGGGGSSSGCSCMSAGADASNGLLAMLGEAVLVALAWSRRRRIAR